MFDIGFTELLVIGVVALVVIGPERLPKVARMAGQWLGRLNRYVSQVKQDIDRDMRLEELRKMQQDMKDSAQKYEIMANDAMHRVEDSVTQETGQISKVMQAMSATDGGLTMSEYEKLRGEEASQAGMDGSQQALPDADAGLSTSGGPEPALKDAQDAATTEPMVQADATPVQGPAKS